MDPRERPPQKRIPEEDNAQHKERGDRATPHQKTPSGPVPEKLYSWKVEYGDIGAVEIDGHTFYFRALTTNEYRSIASLKEVPEIYLEDEVLRRVVLYPEDFNPDDYSAGVPMTLSHAIVRFSSPESAEAFQKDLSAEEERIRNDPFFIMITKICRAFPAISPIELGEMTYYELLTLLAVAEEVAGSTGPEPPPATGYPWSPGLTFSQQRKSAVSQRELEETSIKDWFVLSALAILIVLIYLKYWRFRSLP